MSPRSPRLTGKDIIGILERNGFRVSRTRGSHWFMKHPDGRATVVPVHGGEAIGPGLFARIRRDADLPIETFLV